MTPNQRRYASECLIEYARDRDDEREVLDGIRELAHLLVTTSWSPDWPTEPGFYHRIAAADHADHDVVRVKREQHGPELIYRGTRCVYHEGIDGPFLWSRVGDPVMP